MYMSCRIYIYNKHLYANACERPHLHDQNHMHAHMETTKQWTSGDTHNSGDISAQNLRIVWVARLWPNASSKGDTIWSWGLVPIPSWMALSFPGTSSASRWRVTASYVIYRKERLRYLGTVGDIRRLWIGLWDNLRRKNHIFHRKNYGFL